ncbi:class I SAM-dependent methyltransferase [Methylobacterium trifolii]|uniref:2-methoxy-6-polyprenyl-1,4-benzoquinol methylase, mitochondrial n=1 Tax=Methylobacterium trifolii TaxID=1003092 RepID=A0ABQ4U8U0_9HYPH|nr:class I SAM-dependent methyltransferase [Methylobacterium trifolii]GJE62580.1 2-methoxy-6-polyprenyl-1,4-benzoquinol methylase, mitochondrial [Methylobacterium trifolii]
MAQFHFVEDYERHVRRLMRKHPIDEAMSLAVGGSYAEIGGVECEILLHAGLQPGQSVVDFGCGSGRLAAALGQRLAVEYLGIDVVQALLDYARSKSPPHYRFRVSRTLALPVETASVDMVCAFSVFTHLLQTETYLYLEEMLRCLKPGGTVVCSFLELAAPNAWHAFHETVQQQRTSQVPNLNMFLERSQIEVFIQKLRSGGYIYESVGFLDPTAAPWPSGHALGQTVAILRKGVAPAPMRHLEL